ncbi:MAG: hypothetical protein CNE98_01925 [Bacteroidetes bacterium MED-G17]|nr:MAG: hypothetical protein CBB99_01205 [Bacteroidetes bacterium TMED39]PDH53357.1 MAG: hypothetical protein CNE98_01925 [Bacteroidetes bacterium MED-G17]CAI8358862.1 MAG: Uncharacterised protein [Bacteroidetes bacterium MED-G17]|tara:strand:+ start:8463 stop:9005 length:543 start_codon:yes stop_codon:yes gene_type:complete
MNSKIVLFKSTIIIMHLLAVVLVLLPFITMMVYTKEQPWKYGFTFIEANFKAALFVSFAFSFFIVGYNAITFETLHLHDLSSYLKAKQVKSIGINKNFQEIQAEVLADIKQLRWKVKSETPEKILLYAKNQYFTADNLEIRLANNQLKITSKPFVPIFFIDFGRNHRHLTTVENIIRKKL